MEIVFNNRQPDYLILKASKNEEILDCFNEKWAQEDLNLRPNDYESSALTN